MSGERERERERVLIVSEREDRVGFCEKSEK